MNSNRKSHRVDVLTLSGAYFVLEVHLQDAGISEIAMRVNQARVVGGGAATDRWHDVKIYGAEEALQELADLSAKLAADITAVKGERT